MAHLRRVGFMIGLLASGATCLHARPESAAPAGATGLETAPEGLVPASWPRAFRSAPAGFSSNRAFNEPWVCSLRFIEVDSSVLFGGVGPGGARSAAQDRIVLGLDEGREIALQRVNKDLGVGETPLWFGEIENDPGGYALFVSNNGVVAGKIQSDRLGLWEVVNAGEGVSALRHLQEFALPGCGVTEAQTRFVPPDGEVEPEEPRSVIAERGDFYFADVLFPYTTTARVLMGGTAAIEALIDLSIADTNLAYENSEIILRIRDAGKVEVGYAEAGDLGTDLGRIQDASDGNMDEVHVIRAQVGADLVALITSSSAGGACGIGYLMTFESNTFMNLAFSVTGMNCLAQFTLAHELGHNMGCHHDRDNAVGQGCFSYSYGYRAPGAAFRTIMSYAPGTRIAHFSNPDVTYNSQPTGVAIGLALETANAQTINQTADTVALWRTLYTSAPSSFNLLTPAQGSTTANRHPTLTWQEPNQTDFYKVQIDEDSNFGSPVIDAFPVLTNSYTVTSNVLVPGLTYYWRIYASNPLGTTLCTPQFRSFVVPMNLPGAFTLSAPSPGQTGVSTKPLLEWTVSVDADSYTLTIDDNSDFSSPVANIAGIAGTLFNLQVPELAPVSTYFWRVRATNIVGTTTATPVPSQFTTAQAPPAAFGPTAPTDGAFISTLTPTLQWSPSLNATSYEVVIDDQPTLNSPLYTAINIPGTSKAVPQGVLLNNGYYFWQVKAVNGVGTLVGSPPTIGFGTSLTPCSGDANGDRSVNFADISSVLANWGGSGPGGDANGDLAVNFVDITTVLGSFGTPCP